MVYMDNIVRKCYPCYNSITGNESHIYIYVPHCCYQLLFLPYAKCTMLSTMLYSYNVDFSDQ